MYSLIRLQGLEKKSRINKRRVQVYSKVQSTLYVVKVTGKIGIFIIKNENCVNGHPYLGVCTQPKWTNQVSRMDFWWSVYSSSTSFFLEQRYHCTALHCQKKDLSIIKVVALLELKVNICTSIFKIKSTHHHNLLLSTSTHKEIIF